MIEHVCHKMVAFLKSSQVTNITLALSFETKVMLLPLYKNKLNPLYPILQFYGA